MYWNPFSMSLIYDSEVLSAIFSNNNHRFPSEDCSAGIFEVNSILYCQSNDSNERLYLLEALL